MVKKPLQLYHIGALHVLLGPKNDGRVLVKKDWRVLRQLWPTLVSSKHSEKRTISVLFEKLINSVAKLARTFGLDTRLPDETVMNARHLWKVLVETEDVVGGPGRNLGDQNVADYEGLQDHLCQLVTAEGEEALHWRHQVRDMLQFCHSGFSLKKNAFIKSST